MSDSTLDRRKNDEGFGLVEVVVAMFLLAVISMAMIPLLVQGVRASSTNAQMSTATQLVAQRINIAKAAGSSCAALRNVAAVSITPVVDTNGTRFTLTQTVGSCPTSFPALISCSTTVKVGTTTLSNASMSILVTSA